MPTVSIRQSGRGKAKVAFDGADEREVRVADPFKGDKAAEVELEWYFEQRLKEPYLGDVRANAAAASIREYGESLFEQVFRKDPDVYADYKRHQTGVLSIEVTGDFDFHRLHWETLWDPSHAQPLACQAVLVRHHAGAPGRAVTTPVAPMLRVLLLVSRPHKNDVGYRTISRPLVDAVHQAGLPVAIEIVRPGSWNALTDHLNGKPQGYYHVLHLDAHGNVLPTAQLEALEKKGEIHLLAAPAAVPGGESAVLWLDGPEEDKPEAVSAQRLADLLTTHQIPIAIVNACQSAKQKDTPEETSLAAHLARAGAHAVVAMAYSVTVTAAAAFVPRVYQSIFAGEPFHAAIRAGRRELWENKTRRGWFNLPVNLEDWMLPVVHQSRAARISLREMTADEQNAFFAAQGERFAAPAPLYGFHGRDLEILAIERRVLAAPDSNLLLVEGMGGAGKSTLLRHLAHWWQLTGFCRRVIYFGWDEQAWKLPAILQKIAEAVLPPAEFGKFTALGETAREQRVIAALRAERHLLILDNLESITGEHMAIRNTLTEPERGALRDWLAKLRGGRSVVLLGSRSKEAWLAKGTFGNNRIELAGLDPQSASAMADRILGDVVPARRAEIREDPAFQRLLKLLAGYPLALQVVLANLARQSPGEIVEALFAGAPGLDKAGDAQDKTASIVRCIEYSHGNLSPDAQALLACFAPFTGVVFAPMLPQYVERLRKQPALAGLPWERMEEVIREAEQWGLVRRGDGGFLELQPVFPYFLRTRADGGQRQAIEAAFRDYYEGVAGAIFLLQESKEAREKQLGLHLAEREYENLDTAIRLSLAARGSILEPYRVLSRYLDSRQDHARGLALGQSVLAEMELYPTELLRGRIGVEAAVVIDDIGKRLLLSKCLRDAEKAYLRALELHESNVVLPKEERGRLIAGVRHQLGVVALEERRWDEANDHYRRALAICLESNDRYSQAGIHHQLGRVAQEQRKWEEAEGHYRQALAFYEDFDDRYEQGDTHHQLGVVAQGQGKWEEAEGRYSEALAIFDQYQDRYPQARTYHQLGTVALMQRKWEEAERYYRQAVAIFVDFDDRHSQASTYHQLGMVAQVQRKWEEAEAYYRQALAIKVQFNDRYSQASTYGQLGLLAMAQERWPEAEEHLLQDLVISAEYKDNHSIAITLHNLARLRSRSQSPTILPAVARILNVPPGEAEKLLAQIAKAASA
ncbi:MAG: tetratricopeptide repeat protein [Bryobacteraceae bacterium]